MAELANVIRFVVAPKDAVLRSCSEEITYRRCFQVRRLVLDGGDDATDRFPVLTVVVYMLAYPTFDPDRCQRSAASA